MSCLCSEDSREQFLVSLSICAAYGHKEKTDSEVLILSWLWETQLHLEHRLLQTQAYDGKGGIGVTSGTGRSTCHSENKQHVGSGERKRFQLAIRF